MTPTPPATPADALTYREGVSRSTVRFADFIDDTLRSYAASGQFRSALHSEAPGAPQTLQGICPPNHSHGHTGTCYGNHGCRCDGCRAASSKRQKRNRMRRAVDDWKRMTA